MSFSISTDQTPSSVLQPPLPLPFEQFPLLILIVITDTRPNSPAPRPEPQRGYLRRKTSGPRIKIRVPKQLYLVELAFAEHPDVLAFCNQIWDLYAQRWNPTFLLANEIDQIETVCRTLLKRIDPLELPPRPKFIIKIDNLDPRFSVRIVTRIESKRLARERLGPLEYLIV